MFPQYGMKRPALQSPNVDQMVIDFIENAPWNPVPSKPIPINNTNERIEELTRTNLGLMSEISELRSDLQQQIGVNDLLERENKTLRNKLKKMNEEFTDLIVENQALMSQVGKRR